MRDGEIFNIGQNYKVKAKSLGNKGIQIMRKDDHYYILICLKFE